MNIQQFPEMRQMARMVCDTTREMIVSGQIEEGQRITEAFLSDLFRVSRSPVREALRMLAYEGFVELLPYKGARVSVIRRKNVKEHYQLKAMLDGYGCYVAAQTFGRDDLDALAQNIEETVRHIDMRNYEGMTAANTAFHGQIIEGADNAMLSQYYDSLSQNLRRYSELSLGDDARWEQVLREHRAIYDALCRKDAIGAFEAANRHALEAMERVMNKITVPGDVSEESEERDVS
jgi:DNA-binding GntR family transcriptional regulator